MNWTKPCRGALGLLALTVCVAAGCGSKPAAGEIDPAIEQATRDFWSAVAGPDFGPNQQGQPNWKRAYELLHPDTRSRLSLDQFNQREAQRLAGKDGPLFRIHIEAASVSDNIATVQVTLHFGDHARPGQPVRVETRLRTDGGRWAAVETSDL